LFVVAAATNKQEDCNTKKKNCNICTGTDCVVEDTSSNIVATFSASITSPFEATCNLDGSTNLPPGTYTLGLQAISTDPVISTSTPPQFTVVRPPPPNVIAVSPTTISNVPGLALTVIADSILNTGPSFLLCRFRQVTGGVLQGTQTVPTFGSNIQVTCPLSNGLTTGQQFLVELSVDGTTFGGNGNQTFTLQAPPPNNSGKSNVGAIVGGIIGAIIAILLLGVAIFLLVRRSRNNKQLQSPNKPEDATAAASK